MKRLFVQLLQWITRYRKRLIYGALALFIGQICFFNLWWFGINNVTYAAEPDTPSQNASFQERATKWLQDLSFLERCCYVLLYPILILAWWLVDNSWVYAEVFKFDAVLWQYRNIVRNLANYALWFLLVFKIFQFLTSQKEAGKIQDILKSTLIAWIWIQASRFILAVLIDISNILTYSVGWLPIHILGSQDKWDGTNFWNPYVFQTVISVDFDDPDTVYFYLSNTTSGWNVWSPQHFIAECETFSFDYEGKTEELIVAPKVIYYCDGKNYYKTESNVCHVWDDVFYFWGLANGITWETCSSKNTCKDSQNKYHASVVDAVQELKQKDKNWIKWDISAWKVLQIKNAHLTWDDIWVSYWDGSEYWLDVDNVKSWKGWNMKRLSDILEWDDGYVWVFSALYTSLLNAGSVFNASDTWIYVSLLNKILSFCHTLAVGIPLIAMLLVFLMRIGVIWIAIILSPVIILLKAFKLEKRMSDHVEVYKFLSVENLIYIIFSPAIICFAVSISTVLVRIIATVNAEHVITEKSSILWWLIELNLGWLWVSLWKLICSVIWVAISRFLIWSAVRSSELWKSNLISWKNWHEWLKWLAESAIWSVPIVPVPSLTWQWVEYFWINKAFGLNGQTSVFSDMASSLKQKYVDRDNNALKEFMNPERAAEDAQTRLLSDYTQKLTSSSIDSNWITRSIWIWQNSGVSKTFRDFGVSEQENIVTSINKLGKDKLSWIPDGHEIVLNWGKRYKFVSTKASEWGGVADVYKYEPQEK